MNGQWLGRFDGSEGGGTILVNVDEREKYYEGVAYTHPANTALPSAAAFFRTPNKDAKSEFRTTAVLPIDPATYNVISWEAIKDRFDTGISFSQHADVTASLDAGTLTLHWTTDIGFTGNCVLPRSRAGEPSELCATQSDWNEFKRFVSDLKGKRYLFRGQGKPHRLRTSFHRTGRADILRFRNEDLQVLRKHLSAKTKHFFNFDIPDEFGAFLNLIQHHGYPTPLLDWTFSPFVAVFFAYRRISNEDAAKADLDARVRVFVFEQEQWKTDLRRRY